MTGIPVYNVNNNCATGSSALFLAHQLISGHCNTLPPSPIIGTKGKSHEICWYYKVFILSRSIVVRHLLKLNTGSAIFCIFSCLPKCNKHINKSVIFRFPTEKKLIFSRCVGSGGVTKCALALGFEKMQKGSLSSVYTDRANPIQPHVETMMALR